MIFEVLIFLLCIVQVLIKTLYLSVDPAQRCQMNEDTGVEYLQPWKINETVQGLGVGVIVKSEDKDFSVGKCETIF